MGIFLAAQAFVLRKHLNIESDTAGENETSEQPSQQQH